MALSSPFQRLWSLALFSLVVLAPNVSAGPAINVALQASFNAAPYLVELLYVQILTQCYVGR